MLLLKLLQHEKQGKPKRRRREKVRAKINEIETKRNIQSMEQKAGSLKK
jgi:hypothetical protein